ncbi:MAG: radical SAM/SPASM domain-containing protein [Alphaproteobacteria bacterium]
MPPFSSRFRSAVRQYAGGSTTAKRLLRGAEAQLGLWQHTAARIAPRLIGARPRKLTVAVTAHCNLRCVGCRYGRDFMPGEQLPYPVVHRLLTDAKAAGMETVRLYGGEPLLHPDLPAMIKHAVGLGLSPYVTTNGLLLRQKIDQLHEAGLRTLTIGFYGVGDDYDRYVQRDGRYRRLEDSIAFVRERYGSEISIQLNFLLSRSSCNPDALTQAWDFARRYDLEVQLDLIHYSLPYFTMGPDRELQFEPSDRDAIMTFVDSVVKLKMQEPDRIRESMLSILSIPSWLLKGPDMAVPCDAHKLIWVGADGTVKLCYVTFVLGNLHEKPLSEMLFTAEHRNAARDAFLLNCPNCHCERESRILKHAPSRREFGSIAKQLRARPPEF